ncbi:MAG: TldD/PmbA family protein [Defluviitaleaceae bacterium]|nr:TldD/PmbA family protein [Defluviitaleaceae bacterium]
MKDIAAYAVEAMVKAGADKASCTVSSGRKDELNVETNNFSLLRTLFEDKLSLKAIKGGRKGTITVNKLDKESVNKAVEECITLTASATPDEAEDIAPMVENKNFNRLIGGSDMAQLFARSKELLETVADQYPQINLDLNSIFNNRKSVYANSNGAEFCDETEYYSLSTNFTAKEGEASSSFNYYYTMMDSLAMPFLDMGMQRSLIEDSVKSLKTRTIDDKFVGKIIVAPSCDDMVWYTILSCFLSNYALISDTSRWKDALGTVVADKKLTMCAAPLAPEIIAAERFSGDGFVSQDADFIRDGVLTSFALDLYGANKTGKPRTANTSFYNIEVAAGDTPLADMVKGIDKGILLNRFSGASPGPSGDISGVAKNSFLIENGQITDAISETMVSFNIVDILKNIPAISKERSANGVTLLPWCCFDGITVSGK